MILHGHVRHLFLNVRKPFTLLGLQKIMAYEKIFFVGGNNCFGLCIYSFNKNQKNVKQLRKKRNFVSK